MRWLDDNTNSMDMSLSKLGEVRGDCWTHSGDGPGRALSWDERGAPRAALEQV